MSAALVALLDINVLIALVDPRHIHHEIAHQWFSNHAHDGWASCPITQNGFLRILSNPRYPNSPGGPSLVLPLLCRWLEHPQHVFWPDDLSWVSTNSLQGDKLLSHGQVTDSYLLALAVRHQGVLVTLDRRLSSASVPGAGAAVELIQPLS